MTNLVIFGASGSLGQLFLQKINDEKSISNVICVVRSRQSINRLISLNLDTEKFRFMFMTDFEALEKGAMSGSVFLNFSFVSDGPPWTRPIQQRILIETLADLAIFHNALKFVEISSQSVFGYKLSSDVSTRSKPPFLLPEYGLTKLTAENFVKKRLYASEVDCYIIRLGAVFHKNSAPFFQRLISIYAGRSFQSIYNGNCNGTILENALAGILFVCDPQFFSPKKVYHFAEIGFMTWDYFFSLFQKRLPTSRVKLGNYSPKGKTIIDRMKVASRTKLFYLILRFSLSIQTTHKLNYSFFNYLKSLSLTRYLDDSKVDSETHSVFIESFFFQNEYPFGFRYNVDPIDAEKYFELNYNLNFDEQID
jgi:nucleoside-diphosphate-sugar epimerase